MTDEETEGFLADLDSDIQRGVLPSLENFTPEQKDFLLRSCHLIDTEQKRRAAAIVISEIKTDKDERAYKIGMIIARAIVTVRDFTVLVWSVQGMIALALLYLFFGGDIKEIIDLIKEIRG